MKNKYNHSLLYVICGLMTVTLYYTLLHVHHAQTQDKRLDLPEVYDNAMYNAVHNPFCIFPLDGFAISALLILVCFGLFAVLFLGSKKRPKTDQLETNHLMTAHEYKEYCKDYVDPIGKYVVNGSNNIIYSKDIKLAIDNKRTNITANALVVATTGGGKSFRFVAPNLLHFNSNYIVTDPSGELTNNYGKYLENNGYKVSIFSVTDVKHSLRYNPFAYIHSDLDIVVMVDTFIKNTTGKGEKCGEKFWIDCERNLLYAVCGYLWHLKPLEEQNFANVLNLLKKAKIDENNPEAVSELDMMFAELERLDPGNVSVNYYKNFKVGAGKSLKSILISVDSRCAKLELYEMQYLTAKDELHLETFADERRVLFIQVPSGITSFNFIVSMLYSQLFMLLYDYGEKTAKYGYKITLDGYAIKTFRAKNMRESIKARNEAKKFLKDVKAGTTIKFDKKKHLYRIYTTSGKLISWRGSIEPAGEFADKCKELKIEKCQEKCPNHVRMILDEFANIGEIPDFTTRLTTIRKYEISCAIIIQTYSQLEKGYEKDADTIVGNCSTKLFFGSTDTKTIKWMQEMFGKKEVTVKNESYQANGNGSTSYNKQLVPLISETKIRNLRNECIVMIDKQPVYIGSVYDTVKDPKFKEAMKTKNKFVYPKNDFDEEKLLPLRERSSYLKKIQEETIEHKDAGEPKTANVLYTKKPRYKKDASKINEELQKLDKNDVKSKEYQTAAVKGLLKSLKLEPDADIKETVESIVDMQKMSENEVFDYKTG